MNRPIETSDEALLRQMQTDPVQADAAFEQIVRRYGNVVFRLAVRNTGNEEQAREIAQEVFVRAWKKLRGWRFRRAKLTTWIYRTTLNVCREAHRKNRKDAERSASIDPDLLPAPPGNNGDGRKRYLWVRQLVLKLPPRQREVVWLHVFEEQPLKDVAAALGIPLGTVKSNYHKALENLRTACRQQAQTAPEEIPEGLAAHTSWR